MSLNKFKMAKLGDKHAEEEEEKKVEKVINKKKSK